MTEEPEDEEPAEEATDSAASDLDDDEKNEAAFNAARAKRGRYMGVSVGTSRFSNQQVS